MSKKEVTPAIPGTEDPKNPKVHAAGKRYVARRDERMKANEEEKAAHTTLLEIMDKENISSYRNGELEIHIDSNRKAKVKIEGKDSGEEE